MVGIVSSIPSGGNFIYADFETPQCQCCTKPPEMSDLCYLGKTIGAKLSLNSVNSENLSRVLIGFNIISVACVSVVQMYHLCFLDRR